MKKLLSLLLCSLLMTAAGLALAEEDHAHADDPDAVHTFVSPEVEAGAIEFLGKTESITYGDLEDVTALTFTGIEHLDISDLAHMPHLHEVTFVSCTIQDYSPLSDLSLLVSLAFVDMDEPDLIDKLPANAWLQYLGLVAMRVDNVSGLSKFASLEQVGLQACELSDDAFAQLTSMDTLAGLSLRSQGLTEIPDISKMTGLKYLVLSENEISDLTPLQNMANLVEIDLSNNKISDISVLAGMSSLANFALDNNQITDLSPVKGLTDLTVVSFGDNPIADFSALEGLENLTGLFASNCGLSDLSVLSGLGAVEVMNLDNNGITDLSPLAQLSSLSALSVQNNDISDFSPLLECEALELLYMAGNAAEDKTVLETLSQQLLVIGLE